MPITVLCAQNDLKNTIPGFVGLFNGATTINYSKFLKEIKKYLLKNLGYNLEGYLMIDKSEAERTAAVDNGFSVLMCEFHLVKIFEEKLAAKKYIKEIKNGRDITCFDQIKTIQSSSTRKELEDNCYTRRSH